MSEKLIMGFAESMQNINIVGAVILLVLLAYVFGKWVDSWE